MRSTQPLAVRRMVNQAYFGTYHPCQKPQIGLETRLSSILTDARRAPTPTLSNICLHVFTFTCGVEIRIDTYMYTAYSCSYRCIAEAINPHTARHIECHESVTENDHLSLLPRLLHSIHTIHRTYPPPTPSPRASKHKKQEAGEEEKKCHRADVLGSLYFLVHQSHAAGV